MSTLIRGGDQRTSLQLLKVLQSSHGRLPSRVPLNPLATMMVTWPLCCSSRRWLIVTSHEKVPPVLPLPLLACVYLLSAACEHQSWLPRLLMPV